MMIHDENHNFQFSGQKVTVSSSLTLPSQFVNLTIGLSGKPLFYFVFSPIAFVRTFTDNIMKYVGGGGNLSWGSISQKQLLVWWCCLYWWCLYWWSTLCNLMITHINPGCLCWPPAYSISRPRWWWCTATAPSTAVKSSSWKTGLIMLMIMIVMVMIMNMICFDICKCILMKHICGRYSSLSSWVVCILSGGVERNISRRKKWIYGKTETLQTGIDAISFCIKCASSLCWMPNRENNQERKGSDRTNIF